MRTIIFAFLILTISGLQAQNDLKGKVFDAETNQVIPGVVVYIPKLHKGTMTDKNGEFVISKIQQSNIDVSFSLIGYQTKILHLNEKNITNKFEVKLEQQAFETQEVVVSGNRFSLQHETAIDIKNVQLNLQTDLESNFLQSLANKAGVDMISKGNGLQKPVIRGLSNTNILVVDNGIRKENFQFSENHPYLIDDNGIERIEIIKGPASLMYGSDAVGGVIFLLPEKPALQNTIQGTYKSKYSFNDNGFATSIGLKGATKKIHLGVNLSLKSFEDFYDARNIQVPNSRFNNISVKANAGTSYKFGKSDIYFDYSKMKIGLTVASIIPLIDDNSRINDIWYQDLDSKILAIKNKLFFNKLMLDADFSYQANRRKLITQEFMPVDMNLVTYSYNIKNTYSLKNNSQLIGGIQGMLQTNENFDAPNHVIPDANLNDFAVYVMMSNKVKEKINFSAGLRYDYREIITDEEINKPAVDRDFNDFSYSVGATYNISKQLLFRANFASAHRTPNIAELTENGIHGDIYELGNLNLKTQINYEPDLSLHFHNNFIVLDFATYYNRINDYIFLENTGNLTDEGIKIYKYNQTNAKIKGFETGFKVMPLNHLKIFANYSFIDAKKDNGEYLPFIPQNKINSTIKYVPKFKVLKFNFSSSIDFVYAFKQDKFSVFETETPEYFVSNFSINFKRKIKNRTFQFAIKVSNLFNETYVDHLSTNKNLGFYSQGRNLTAVIKYVF